jgi:hypothetical protein
MIVDDNLKTSKKPPKRPYWANLDTKKGASGPYKAHSAIAVFFNILL